MPASPPDPATTNDQKQRPEDWEFSQFPSAGMGHTVIPPVVGGEDIGAEHAIGHVADEPTYLNLRGDGGDNETYDQCEPAGYQRR